MDLIRRVFNDLSHGVVPPQDVITLLITRVSGYCLTVASGTIKLPQISAVYKSKSIVGLSILAFELETYIPGVHSAYGYIMELDFSAYGEAVVSFIQAAILMATIYWYGDVSKGRQGLLYGLLIFGGALVYLDCISKTYIAIAYTFNELFFAIARFTQIHKNYKESDSGELSLLSNALMALGCFIRILTSVRENASLLFILGFVQGTLLHGVVTAQIAYYQHRDAAKSTKNGNYKVRRSESQIV